MNLTTRMRAWFARGLVKSMGIVWVPDWMRAKFMEPTFRALVRDGYRANSAVFACVSALVFAFSEPKLRVYRETETGREALPDHPLSLLFKKPNAQMGMLELLVMTMVYLAIGGNAYWLKVRSGASRVVEIWVLSDHLITPIPGGDKLVSHYEFGGAGTSNPTIIPTEDIVHFKWMVDPLKPWRGIAPLAAASREVDTDNEVSRYLHTLLKNDAIPRIALIAPPDQFIDDDKYERMRKRWLERYGGDNRGIPAVLEGGVDVKTLGLDLNQLAFEGLHGVPETRIAAALRVPPIVAGLGVGISGSTYANQAGMDKAFTQRTIVPLWRMVEEELTADILSDFGTDTDLVVAFDISEVVVLQEDANIMRAFVAQAVGGGYMTVNEGRKVLHLPTVVDGDVFLRSFSADTVPAEFGKPRQMRALELSDAPDETKPRQGRDAGTTDATDKPANDAGTDKPADEGKRARLAAKAKRTQRAAGEKHIAELRKIRARVSKAMEKDLDKYFADLATRVVARLKGKALALPAEAKTVPADTPLLTSEDSARLEDLVQRYFVQVMQASWNTWNAALGVEVAFDLVDETVTNVLRTAATRVRMIDSTTRDEIRSLLQYANENGWSIDQIVAGDAEGGIRGLRDVVEQTYARRAETIARTELGTAQNNAATDRYQRNGVQTVLVMDNGLDDDDEPCKEADGAEWTLEEAMDNPLEHPNCTRAFAPLFA